MPQDSLLRTKLYIPSAGPDLVSRPRLLERLNAALAALATRDAFSRALTLISAPAGFGKTTLLSAWVSHLGLGIAGHRFEETAPGPYGHRESAAQNRVAWLSLDDGDNDPTRFLAYLIAASRAVEAKIGRGALSALQSPQPPPPEVALTPQINEIAAMPEGMLLVLDDNHLAEAQPGDDALTFLLEHLPPQVHLVITTRDDPHLSLARLRARVQLTELRASDLRFASSEAAAFLNPVTLLSVGLLTLAPAALLKDSNQERILYGRLGNRSKKLPQDLRRFHRRGRHHF